MNDVIIRAKDLRKIYRLYSKPSYRFRDIFGLLGDKQGAYTEHAALDGLNLDIRRGERVAIIGRNGAGKSTFLKLVTGVIEPTSGELQVNARVHALLQIGTGFHPDFSGRENVYAYLAQLGITGADANAKCAEAIEFAEIEEYIDQPVKTYSTGMAVRLMFATSTAITPDLLVLDEVLGVGDAYFSQKSFKRMRDLCDRDGATLLLVTHDVYSAAQLCQRIVWIDRGAVMIDDEPSVVMKAYGESIRLQEEHRLRLKKQGALERGADKVAVSSPAPQYVMVEIRGRGGRPQPSAVYFSRIAVMDGTRQIAELPLDDVASDVAGASHIVHEGSNWGPLEPHRDRAARPMINHGLPFHKVAGVIALPADTSLDGLALAVEYASEQSCELTLTAFEGERAIDLGALTTAPGAWNRHTASFRPSVSVRGTPVLEAGGVEGAGDILITRFVMLDANGVDTHTVEHGAAVSFRVHFEVRRPGLAECAQVFVVVSRNEVERVCKFRTAQPFDHAAQPRGFVDLHLPKMMLGAGTYTVAVEIAAEGYLEQPVQKFFSIDPTVYCCITHALEFTVIGTGWIGQGTIFEGEGAWTMGSTS